jgi:hypothetical protein
LIWYISNKTFRPFQLQLYHLKFVAQEVFVISILIGKFGFSIAKSCNTFSVSVELKATHQICGQANTSNIQEAIPKYQKFNLNIFILVQSIVNQLGQVQSKVSLSNCACVLT